MEPTTCNCEQTIALLTRQIELLTQQQVAQGAQLYQLHAAFLNREIAHLQALLEHLREQVRVQQQKIILGRLEF